ncbi:MAG: GT4 family glycosyltransferase PelF [Lachnospiraceae bacterium]|nr:GT4 family glycosyltransferase PelF [Lachnospiraceae bacterium]
MKICIVAEGCYPYVVGGVSGWIHSMIEAFPEHDFIILGMIPNRKQSGKFAYELPKNVSAVYEAYLDDYDWVNTKKEGKRTHLSKKEYRALRSLVLNRRVEWDTLFDMFQSEKFSTDDILMGADFLKIVQEYYNENYPQIVFSDFLWTLRSIYLNLFLVMKTPIPEADVYHCVATGYAGILGAMANHKYGSKLLISEHGIYTREREEEIIKASWVKGIYKTIWIEQFKKMSQVAYDKADLVTSLYSHARELQIELGCPEMKTRVTPNGIDEKRFENIPGKLPEDEGMINIGAVLRVAPIKDVKTMIQAFSFAKQRVSNLKLWIMGPIDEDEEYANECIELVDALGISDVVFTGRVDVAQYIGRMDYTILTSISEGQPLTILEGFANHLPAIATDVGNCRGLIYGDHEGDNEAAGIITHIMNVGEIADAMVDLAIHPDKRKAMGEVGYKRVVDYYGIDEMRECYGEIYGDLSLNRD